ncbi:hypothetical protein [Methanopyrus kandleri]|uniref:Uncharacterized protein n=1 Tax=Methanopyrus kandleri TaxID=2320 RepID=A0A832WAW2_9EURY|nr:hypothetical protein [Methanopyrus kandleri]HII70518.1 hypothetical protein [Methanopyrus kandleri]
MTSLVEGEWAPSHDPRMGGLGLAITGLLFLLPTMATAEVVWGPLVVTLVTALNAWYAVKALSSGPSPLVPLALLEPGLAVLCVVCEPVRTWLAGIPKLVAGALICLEGPVDRLFRVDEVSDDGDARADAGRSPIPTGSAAHLTSR